ncbi:MAG: filamentous hemagglutinin N-terminal domain-containing protein, partial [Rhodospirillaceae bacterium]
MPQGYSVVSGTATITQSGNTMKVVQATPKVAINWQSYTIGTNELVSYYQPSTSAIALNRVIGGGASVIDGRLTANGQLWISNPSGILFGPNARVNVGGLIATTHDLKVEDFNASRYHFQSDPQPSGIVENQGRITVADAGLAAFVAPGVVNHGVITARLGQVALAAGNEFTVDLYGDQKINLALDNAVAQQVLGRDGKPLDALVKTDGKIFADGGRVQISAAAAKGLVDNVVSIGGLVQARSVEQHNGEIVLLGDGGTVQVTGTLDASGKATGQTGGTAVVSGDAVTVTAGARIDVTGSSGGGQALIGGDFRGGNATSAEYVDYAIRPARKPVPPAETTTIEAGATITADALSSGRGGEIIAWSNDATAVKGILSAKGGSLGGGGGFIETSGHWLDINGISASTKAIRGVSGTWLLDPWNVTISATGTSNLSTGGEVDPGADTTILASTLSTALNGGNSVVITTGSGGSSAGDITVNAPISWGTPSSLTLSAYHNVTVNASLSNSGGGSIALMADTSGANNGGQVTLSNGSTTLVQGGFATVSGDSVFLEKGSLLSANSVDLIAPTIVGGGNLSASGLGSSLTLSGDYISLAGSLSATSPAGTGGTIFLDGGSSVMLSGTSSLSANGSKGGSIRVVANGFILDSGVLSATGNAGTGGLIEVSGAGSTTLLGASIDTSGVLGGGSIHVGGGWRGAGSLTASANTTVDGTSTLTANATQAGNGGEVALWSTGGTSFWGSISAQGGPQSGNGGRVELSSAGSLSVQASAGHGVSVNALAPGGSNGTTTVDPANVVIGDAIQPFDIWRSLLTSNGQLANTSASALGLGANASFGLGVALNENYALIGAHGLANGRGNAYLYSLLTGAWTDLSTTNGQPITGLSAGASFGYSAALNSTYALLGASAAGPVGQGDAYLYNIATGSWTDLITTAGQPITALTGNQTFGNVVALNSSNALIGAYNGQSGDAYLYNLINGAWTDLGTSAGHPATAKTANQGFAASVALNSKYALIGENESTGGRGNAYLYNLSTGAWLDLSQTNNEPLTGLTNSRFGQSVALSQTYALIGSSVEASTRGNAYLYNLRGRFRSSPTQPRRVSGT